MKIAVTADLHWGIRPDGDEASGYLLEALRADPPDLLLLAGDLGAGEEFARGLAQFADLPCLKAVVPGNHDVWVTHDDLRGDSLEVYDIVLPGLCARYGFYYLDQSPLLWSEAGLAVVGSMNWYDYSWIPPDRLAAVFPDWEDRLRTKRFTRGRHNDARFVRWSHDDSSFTQLIAQKLACHLELAEAAGLPIVVVTHHPPCKALSFPRQEPLSPDGMLWEAFGGNQSVEDLLQRHARSIRWVFCGHTHRARLARWEGIQGANVGSDYGFKNLLRLESLDGPLQIQEFHARELIA